ncbi:hypothetical protein HAX54_024255, partial [Datura stramonium]|nr:hypothetical protein [Datura stramonium]
VQVIGHDFQQKLSLNSENGEQYGRTCALGIVQAKQQKAWHEAQAKVPHGLARRRGDIAATQGATCRDTGASRPATLTNLGTFTSASHSRIGASSAASRSRSSGGTFKGKSRISSF